MKPAMDKYKNLGVIGEGSYGIVLKCRHKDTGQLVAIKKFMETDDDLLVKKIAVREVRMLKRLTHENLVNLLEVFRRKQRLFLVFEYVDHTVLKELEENPDGLPWTVVRQHSWQLLRGVEYCHTQNIIHRDIKPENILISAGGVVKLCDFGFARMMPGAGESCTDYVATRWYRAPELLVGDTKYGREVDVWAIGCLFAEMMSGDPLFPGESDVDQLFQIIKCMGRISPRHLELISTNPTFHGMKVLMEERRSLEDLFSDWPTHCLHFISCCLEMDPMNRPSCTTLLHHKLFTHDGFPQVFYPHLKKLVESEFLGNPLLHGKRRSALLPHSSKKHHDGFLSPVTKSKDDYQQAWSSPTHSSHYPSIDLTMNGTNVWNRATHSSSGPHSHTEPLTAINSSSSINELKTMTLGLGLNPERLSMDWNNRSPPSQLFGGNKSKPSSTGSSGSDFIKGGPYMESLVLRNPTLDTSTGPRKRSGSKSTTQERDFLALPDVHSNDYKHS